jgi:ankyrin repeat protein
MEIAPVAIATAVAGIVGTIQVLLANAFNTSARSPMLKYDAKWSRLRKDIQGLDRELARLRKSLGQDKEGTTANTAGPEHTEEINQRTKSIARRLATIRAQMVMSQHIARILAPLSKGPHLARREVDALINNVTRAHHIVLVILGLDVPTAPNSGFEVMPLGTSTSIDKHSWAVVGQQDSLTEDLMSLSSFSSSTFSIERTPSLRYDHAPMVRWLETPSLDERHHQYTRIRYPKTCDWFFDTDTYKSWMSESVESKQGKFLWFKGSAGVGKTILSSRLVNHRRSTCNDIVAYSYLGRGEKVSGVTILVDILKQICRALRTIPPRLPEMYERLSSGRDLELNEMLHVMHELAPAQRSVLIVIDALDDTNFSQATDILKVLEFLSHSRWKTFVTTRGNSKTLGPAFRGCVEYQIDTTDNKVDVARYLKGCITHSPINDLLTQESGQGVNSDQARNRMLEEVVRKIWQNANGTFFWAVQQLRLISEQSTYSEIRKVLDENFSSRDQLTFEALQRIEKQPENLEKLARRTVRWLIEAGRALTMIELCHGLAVKYGDRLPDPNNLPSPDYVEKSCLGLVSTDPGKNAYESTVSISHPDLHDLCLSPRGVEFLAKADSLASVCVSYLSFEAFAGGPCKDVDSLSCRRSEYPFFDYCCRFWGYHIGQLFDVTIAHEEVSSKILDFYKLNDGRNFAAACQVLHLQDVPRDLQNKEWERIYQKSLTTSLLHFAARYGLQALVESWEDWDVCDSDSSTALHEAAAQGQQPFTELLIRHISDTEHLDTFGRSPLDLAIQNGHHNLTMRLLKLPNQDGINRSFCEAVKSGDLRALKELLNRGANVNCTQDNQPALHIAISARQLGALRYLLARGAGADTIEPVHSRSALHCAATVGIPEAVETLLLAGANITQCDDTKRTPLFSAVDSGSLDVVKVLLSYGSEVNKCDDKGINPITLASGAGQTEIVQLLLECGAVGQGDTASPLHAAVGGGHLEVVQLLLSHGFLTEPIANANLDSLIDLAITSRRNDVVRLLLSVPAEFVHSPPWLSKALLTAVRHDNHEAICMLFQCSSPSHQDELLSPVPTKHSLKSSVSTPSSTSSRYPTALDVQALEAAVKVAAECNHQKSLDALLRTGTSSRVKDGKGNTLMTVAAQNGSEDVVQLLLRHPTFDLEEAKNLVGKTPLMVAAERGYLAIVKLLLDASVAIDDVDDSNRTAMMLAAARGRTAVVQVLLQRGSDVDHKDFNDDTALNLAALEGHLTTVQLLQTYKAKPDLRNLQGRNAAALARSNKHREVQLVLAPPRVKPPAYLEYWFAISSCSYAYGAIPLGRAF